MKNMILEVKELTKTYGKKQALQDVSFMLGEGQFVAALGPNGAGKTTLLRCISGLIELNTGNILLNTEKLRRDNIVYVFDHPVLYETLTGEEHVRFVLDLNGLEWNKKEIKEELEKFEVLDYANRRIEEYSLGMKKKMQLLCAMLTRPKLLLLDEYISGLDPISLRTVERILKDYVNQGNTILLSTHILGIAERLCNKVMFIKEGRLIKSIDDMKTIKDKYSSLDEFYFYMEKRENFAKIH